jgi:PAS domain S-box-containing protein
MKKTGKPRRSKDPGSQTSIGLSTPPLLRVSKAKLAQQNEDLRMQLAEAQETLRAIQEGEVDAIVVSGSRGEQVFSLTGVESVYRLIVETMREMAFTVSLDGTILFANAQFAHCLRRSMEEILGHSLYEFVTANHQAVVDSLLSVGPSEPSKCRLVFRRPDRTLAPAFVSSSLLRLSDGGSVCMVAMDLTELENSSHVIQELHRQEDILRVSEDRFRSVLDSSLDAIYRLNLKTERYEYFSPACLSVYGFSPDEMTEMGVKLAMSHIHPSDRPEVDKLLEQMLSTGQARLEYRWSDKAGKYRWLSSYVTLIRDAEGQPLYRNGITRDISTRRLIEEALRQVAQKYSAMFNTTSDGVWLHDSGGNILEVNDAYCHMSGYSRGELIGMPVSQLEVIESPEEIAARIRKMLDGEGHDRFQSKHRRKDGSVFDVDITALRLNIDGARIAVFARDITDFKHSEDALRKSASRLQLLSNCSSRLLSSSDPQSVVNELCREVMAHLDCQVFFNFMADVRAGRLRLNAYAGISEEEALKIEWLDYGVAVCGCAAQQACRILAEDIAHVPDPRTDLVKSFGVQAYCCHPLIAQGGVIGTISFGTTTRPHFTTDEVEVMRTVADQVAIAMQRVLNHQALKNLNESLEQRVAERTSEVRHQAQRLHALAAELSQAEQSERKRLAKILHDHIQQLLVAAQMHLSLVRQADDASIGPAVQGVESIIREAIDASRSLAVDLSPPILHQGGLGPALGWLANRVEEKNLFKVRVRADSDAEPGSEPMRLLLFESVRELLLNAVKHSGAHEASVTMVRTNEGWTEITIVDNGSGFDPESVSTQNSGLGLFGIQQRLVYVGGKMEVESAPGKGTRIVLQAPPEKSAETLPSQAAITPEVWEQVLASPSEKRKRISILLVDDHSIVRSGLSSLLQLESDFEVVAEAEDGVQALELARQWSPDVVVTDVSMPGMDGVELTRTLVREMPKIKILGLSMHIEKSVAVAMREAGATGYLTKGGLSEDLIAAIRACTSS